MAVQAKKAATKAAEPASTRKSSRISEQSAAKRKAAEDVSPSANKKRKPEAVKADKADKKDKAVEKDKATKTSKKQEEAKEEVNEDKVVAVAEKTKKKGAKKGAKKAAETTETETAEPAETAEATETAEEEDETTKALVEDLDSADEAEEAAEGGASLFQPGQDVGKAPVGKTVGKKTERAGWPSRADNEGPATGGVVYVGRIPHGFFEHEMRSYFSQFGDISRLRLSRNRRTGASKHYAFIEFVEPDVAAIVAQTMDNYLLFGHILRCSVVSPDRVPPHLFVGANRRFKAIPWNSIAGRQLREPKVAAAWTAKNGREEKRRAKRAALLQEKLGYTYAAPGLKTLEAKATKAAETEAEAEAAETEAVEDKKDKKDGEPEAIEAAKATEAETETAVAEAVPTPVKAKKGKGRKSKA